MVLTILLIACTPIADRVRVVTTGNGWPAELLNFEHAQTTPDAGALQSIVAGLPPRDERRISCAFDDGRRLHVELASGSVVVMAFDADVGGCRYVRRDGKISESSEEFWSVLGRASGLDAQQLR